MRNFHDIKIGPQGGFPPKLSAEAQRKLNAALSLSGVGILCLTIFLPLVGISASIGPRTGGAPEFALLRSGSQKVQDMTARWFGSGPAEIVPQPQLAAFESAPRKDGAPLPSYERDSWARRAAAGYSERTAALTRGAANAAATSGAASKWIIGQPMAVDYSTTASHDMSRVRRTLSLPGNYMAEAARLKKIADAAQLRQAMVPRTDFVARGVPAATATNEPHPHRKTAQPDVIARKPQARRQTTGQPILLPGKSAFLTMD